MKTEIEIKQETLECLLISFFEDSMNREFVAHFNFLDYDYEKVPFTEDGKLILVVEDPEKYETVRKEISKETIKSGTEIMAEKYPKHFANLISENHDAITANVWMQCCLYGELIFD